MEDFSIFKNIPEKIYTEENKVLYNNLLEKITEKNWIKIIKCWQQNSSLLRFNSTKLEFQKIQKLSEFFCILHRCTPGSGCTPSSTFPPSYSRPRRSIDRRRRSHWWGQTLGSQW